MFSKEGKTKDVATPRICDVVWHNGEFIKWDDARVHVMSHVLHYGSSIFEGIRCYSTKSGPAIFRLKEHMQRLLNSAKIYRMEHPWTLDQLTEGAVELVRQSGMDQCYIRPILFRSLDEENPAFGVNPFPNPLACYIGAWDWGKYFGDEAIERGVDVCVSTWNRLTPNSMPAMAKSGANYMNSQLIKMEALLNGFAEGIALRRSRLSFQKVPVRTFSWSQATWCLRRRCRLQSCQALREIALFRFVMNSDSR